jgi:hypothetical protein
MVAVIGSTLKLYYIFTFGTAESTVDGHYYISVRASYTHSSRVC